MQQILALWKVLRNHYRVHLIHLIGFKRSLNVLLVGIIKEMNGHRSDDQCPRKDKRRQTILLSNETSRLRTLANKTFNLKKTCK